MDEKKPDIDLIYLLALSSITGSLRYLSHGRGIMRANKAANFVRERLQS
jgi:hypothetical protein